MSRVLGGIFTKRFVDLGTIHYYYGNCVLGCSELIFYGDNTPPFSERRAKTTCRLFRMLPVVDLELSGVLSVSPEPFVVRLFIQFASSDGI